jgi:peroxiredoxin
LGEVSKAVLIPILKSRAYRTASLADKRRIIQVAYNNSVSSDAPAQIKRFRKAAGFSNVNDLRDIAEISMEEEYPVVYCCV